MITCNVLDILSLCITVFALGYTLGRNSHKN